MKLIISIISLSLLLVLSGCAEPKDTNNYAECYNRVLSSDKPDFCFTKDGEIGVETNLAEKWKSNKKSK